MSERISLSALREGTARLSLTAMHEQGPQLFAAICDELLSEIKRDRDAGRNPLHSAAMVPTIAVGRLMQFLEGTVSQEAAYRSAKLASEQLAAARGTRLVL